jgi:hypothetical protein
MQKSPDKSSPSRIDLNPQKYANVFLIRGLWGRIICVRRLTKKVKNTVHGLSGFNGIDGRLKLNAIDGMAPPIWEVLGTKTRWKVPSKITVQLCSRSDEDKHNCRCISIQHSDDWHRLSSALLRWVTDHGLTHGQDEKRLSPQPELALTCSGGNHTRVSFERV